MHIIHTIYLITWLVTCPICGDNVETKSTVWDFNESKKDSYTNYVECPKCHVALVARPKEWEYKGTDDGIRMVNL